MQKIKNKFMPQETINYSRGIKNDENKIEGIAYDGTDIIPDFVPTYGNFKPIEEYCLRKLDANFQKIGKEIQKDLDKLLYGINYSLQRIEYLRTFECITFSNNCDCYIVVRLRHINNTYPKYYFAVNIPEKQAEILFCFTNDDDKQEFIKNQDVYFNGKPFDSLIRDNKKMFNDEINHMVKYDEYVSNMFRHYEMTAYKVACVYNSKKQHYHQNFDVWDKCISDGDFEVKLLITLKELARLKNAPDEIARLIPDEIKYEEIQNDKND